MFNIEKVLSELGKKRKIFNSEADFQFALAWKIQELYPNVEIRLEYCPAILNTSMHIDILVIDNNEWIPIELKYKTRYTNKTVDSELYVLKNQGAIDLGSYNFIKDISRLEYLRDTIDNFKCGYAIMITNELRYTKEVNKNVLYCNFSLTDNSVKTGNLKWNTAKEEGWTKNRKPITLSNSYTLNWKEYSVIDNESNGTFKSLAIEVKNNK